MPELTRTITRAPNLVDKPSVHPEDPDRLGLGVEHLHAVLPDQHVADFAKDLLSRSIQHAELEDLCRRYKP